MSKHTVELVGVKFTFKVNSETVEVWFSERNRTIILFRGVTVYTSKFFVKSAKEAEEMIFRYLESIR